MPFDTGRGRWGTTAQSSSCEAGVPEKIKPASFFAADPASFWSLSRSERSAGWLDSRFTVLLHARLETLGKSLSVMSTVYSRGLGVWVYLNFLNGQKPLHGGLIGHGFGVDVWTMASEHGRTPLAFDRPETEFCIFGAEFRPSNSLYTALHTFIMAERKSGPDSGR